jgi:hypothetical protein
MPRYYSVYLNTKTASGPLKPTDKTNLANVSWNINWNAVFPTSVNATRLINNNAKCKVRVNFVSDVNANVLWATNKGTLRINGISSISQYSLGSGLVIGITKPQANPAGTTYYLECDTTQTVGQEVNIPTQSSFSISLLQSDGITLQTNIQEYEIILHFELEDDDKENMILA